MGSLFILQELVLYLRHIRHVWLEIVGSADAAILVDSTTVHSLELMAPTHSTRDKNTIIAAMEAGELFPNVRDHDVRNSILERILGVPGRIPSLFSFLEDTKYLEPCAKVMKKLLPPNLGHSVERAFRRRFVRYRRDGRASVEVRKNIWTEVAATPRQASRAAYLILWLFTMREFPFVGKSKPLQDPGKTVPSYRIRDDLLPVFARLAWHLGFESPQILRYKRQNPFECAVKAFLHAATPRDEYDIDPAGMEMEVQRICQYLQNVPQRRVPTRAPSIITNQAERQHRRYGLPFNSLYVENRPYLYLQYIYSDRGEEMGSYLSRFGVECDIFRAFFGDIPFDAEPLSSVDPDQSHGPSPSGASQTPGDIAGRRLASPTHLQSSSASQGGVSLSPGSASFEEPSTAGLGSIQDSSSGSVETDEVSAIDSSAGTRLCMSQMQDLLTWLLTVPANHRSMVYYCINSGWLYALAEEEVYRNSELVNQTLSGSGYYVCGIDSDGSTFLTADQILHEHRFTLRFFGRRNVRPGQNSIAHAWQLIRSYFPDLDIDDSLLHVIADVGSPD